MSATKITSLRCRLHQRRLVTVLLDDLVCPQQQRRRDRQALSWSPTSDGSASPGLMPPLDLVLAWPSHNAATLSDLVGIVHVLPPDDQKKVWDLIDAWANTEQDEVARASVREQIRRFAFTRRASASGLMPPPGIARVAPIPA